mmetsp:Transcript_26119/g.98355  ORF Transcript_26119/g.98355 Transcript_26119/m.98355 type:complete len:344 (+) Transcript_26119:1206-2237(+)
MRWRWERRAAPVMAMVPSLASDRSSRSPPPPPAPPPPPSAASAMKAPSRLSDSSAWAPLTPTRHPAISARPSSPPAARASCRIAGSGAGAPPSSSLDRSSAAPSELPSFPPNPLPRARPLWSSWRLAVDWPLGFRPVAASKMLTRPLSSNALLRTSSSSSLWYIAGSGAMWARSSGSRPSAEMSCATESFMAPKSGGSPVGVEKTMSGLTSSSWASKSGTTPGPVGAAMSFSDLLSDSSSLVSRPEAASFRRELPVIAPGRFAAPVTAIGGLTGSSAGVPEISSARGDDGRELAAAAAPIPSSTPRELSDPPAAASVAPLTEPGPTAAKELPASALLLAPAWP